MEFSGFHSQLDFKNIDWDDYQNKPEVLTKELSKRKLCNCRKDTIETFVKGSSLENTSNWLPNVPASTPYNKGYTVSVNSSNSTVNWAPPLSTPSPTPTETSIANQMAPPFLVEDEPETVSQNIDTVQSIYQRDINTNKQIVNQFMDLSYNVGETIDKMTFLYNNNEKYKYWGRDDPNVIINPEESQDIRAVLQKDVTEMRLYHNSIYITTAIACATLLIGSIIISK
jgi:hypothetical protein